jgi:3-dehydroshikimate dehydratase
VFRPGLVSITFRKMSPEKVVSAAVEAGLEGIEWGGDIHVPPGNISTASHVATMTTEVGLTTVAYGSYYRFDELYGEHSPDFQAVLDTAEALGAPVIRIWAGRKGSSETTESERMALVERAHALAETAHGRGLVLVFEYHSGTLTDSSHSAVRLMTEISHPAIRLLWQPPADGTVRDRRDDLAATLPWLEHIHCFHWGPTGFEDRRHLSEGAEEWKDYLSVIEGCPHPGPTWVLLEFMPSMHQRTPTVGLKTEAATLRKIIRDSRNF